jgi:hypothetical protein
MTTHRTGTREEWLRDRLELLVKIDRRNAPSRSHRQIPFDADRQRGPVIPLRDASRRESENAFVPVVAGENEDSVAELLGC